MAAFATTITCIAAADSPEQQRQQLAGTEALLPRARGQRTAAAQTLNILRGTAPDDALPEGNTLPEVGPEPGTPSAARLMVDRPDLAQAISEYRQAWKEAGHTGNGDVILRMGAYVAEDMERAISDPKESTQFFYSGMQAPAPQSPQAWVDEQSPSVSQNPVDSQYEAVLRDRLAYGTPDVVTRRLQEIIDELGLSGIIMMPNVGGKIPRDRLSASIRLFGEEVAPRLTSGATKAGIA